MKRLLTTLTFAASISSPAFAITFTGGNIANTDNVLFNDNDAGSLIKGHFNGANSSFVVDFTSSSGSTLLKTQGNGQAMLLGGTGNAPYTQLTLQLENGATFTGLDFNLDASANETANFTVNFLNGSSPFLTSLQLDKNGENRIGILASGNELITSVSLSITAPAANPTSIKALKVTEPDPLGLNDIKQVRMAGMAAQTTFPPEGTPTPDGGATMCLLGTGISALAFLRRKLS